MSTYNFLRSSKVVEFSVTVLMVFFLRLYLYHKLRYFNSKFGPKTKFFG
jgi:hypothetical protein